MGQVPANATENEVILLIGGTQKFLDQAIYNSAVADTTYDIDRGSTIPITNPFTGLSYPLSFSREGILKFNGELPPGLAQYVPNLPVRHDLLALPFTNDAVSGAFKVMGLRNIELTSPFMHNRGMATLAQVIDFYTRGAISPTQYFSPQPPPLRATSTTCTRPSWSSRCCKTILPCKTRWWPFC
jgi:hypothetical protein